MSYRARAIWIVVGLSFGFTVVSFNLIQIQLVQHDKYLNLARQNHLRSEKIPASRGSIFDSDGNLLAETQVRTDLHLDGKLVEHPAEQLPESPSREVGERLRHPRSPPAPVGIFLPAAPPPSWQASRS